MKLCKFHLRYHPPGLLLEYRQSGIKKIKNIDLLDLTTSSNSLLIAKDISNKEKLITPNLIDQLKHCIERLQSKLENVNTTTKHFYIYKTLQNHLLPLTNVAFDKEGKRCLTGSYDRTCKIWNIETGKEEKTLLGHKNVVYSVGYNFPSCDKIVTGSFDKTAKIWDSSNGECVATLWGHQAEVVVASFSPKNDQVATASMDHSARVFQASTGQEVLSLLGHTGEIISLNFNNNTGQQIITGSFDGTISIWDIRMKGRVGILEGHSAGISNCIFNFNCCLIASSSLDKSVRVWDIRKKNCLTTINCHNDEVLDVTFDWCGRRLASVSAGHSAYVHDACSDFRELAIMNGHKDEISKVCFSPGGALLMTASADLTARLWNSYSGDCTQVLTGHRDEVFSCAFNYLGDTVITASKDNTCRVWR